MKNNFLAHTGSPGLWVNEVKKKNVTYTHIHAYITLCVHFLYDVCVFIRVCVDFHRTKQNALCQCRTWGKQIVPVTSLSLLWSKVLLPEGTLIFIHFSSLIILRVCGGGPSKIWSHPKGAASKSSHITFLLFPRVTMFFPAGSPELFPRKFLI